MLGAQYFFSIICFDSSGGQQLLEVLAGQFFFDNISFDVFSAQQLLHVFDTQCSFDSLGLDGFCVQLLCDISACSTLSTFSVSTVPTHNSYSTSSVGSTFLGSVGFDFGAHNLLNVLDTQSKQTKMNLNNTER